MHIMKPIVQYIGMRDIHSRGVARPGHTRATARASGYFALPSAAFPAIKMAYKL